MSEEVPRERVSVPETVELPRAFDFYELQDAEHTGIHRFYANLRDGQLTTTECAGCGERHFPPRVVCPACMGDDLEYVPLPHEGTVYTYTAVRGTAAIGLDEDTPFVVGVVDLGDVKLSARIDDTDLESVEIGDPVRLKIVDIEGPADHDRVFYRFVPA